MKPFITSVFLSSFDLTPSSLSVYFASLTWMCNAWITELLYVDHLRCSTAQRSTIENLICDVHLRTIFSVPNSWTIIIFENHIFVLLENPGSRNVEATFVETFTKAAMARMSHFQGNSSTSPRHTFAKIGQWHVEFCYLLAWATIEGMMRCW